MNTNEREPSPDVQGIESLLRQFQPAPSKASMAETFYRAGYAAAESERAPRSGVSRWLQNGFFSGAASGIAACLVVWIAMQAFRPETSDPRMMAAGSTAPRDDRTSDAPKDTDVSLEPAVESTPMSPAEAVKDPRIAVSGLVSWMLGMESDRPTPTQRTMLDDRNAFSSSLSYLQSQQWDRTQKAGRAYATRSTSTTVQDSSRAKSTSSERADLKSLWRSVHEDELGL